MIFAACPWRSSIASKEASRGPSVETESSPVSSIGKKPFGIATAIQPAAASEAMKKSQTTARQRRAMSSAQA